MESLGGGGGVAKGVDDDNDGGCYVDDEEHDLLTDHATRDDHALLSFPTIQPRNDDDPATLAARLPPPPPTQQAETTTATTTHPRASSHSPAFAREYAEAGVVVDPSFPSSSLPAASNDPHQGAAACGHAAPSLLPTNVTEGFPNRRLSWAERRSMRERLRSNALDEHTNSLTELREELNCNNGERGFQYEEFMKDSVPCPSCGGGGRIDRDTESKLVALIPYDDERLKPRRTWIHVGVAVTFSILLALTTLFFLFPRTIKMSSERRRIQPLKIDIQANISSPYVYLLVQNNFTIENSNYVPVTFESVTMRVTAFERTLNATTNNTQVMIPLRSSQTVYATVELYFKNALAFIAPYCADPRVGVHSWLFKFDVAAQASILGHSQDMAMSVFQWVSCGYDVNADGYELDDPPEVPSSSSLNGDGIFTAPLSARRNRRSAKERDARL